MKHAKPARLLLAAMDNNGKFQHKGLSAARHFSFCFWHAIAFKGNEELHPTDPGCQRSVSEASFSFSTSVTAPSSCVLTPYSSSRWDYPSQQAGPVNTQAHHLINTPLVRR